MAARSIFHMNRAYHISIVTFLHFLTDHIMSEPSERVGGSIEQSINKPRQSNGVIKTAKAAKVDGEGPSSSSAQCPDVIDIIALQGIKHLLFEALGRADEATTKNLIDLVNSILDQYYSATKTLIDNTSYIIIADVCIWPSSSETAVKERERVKRLLSMLGPPTAHIMTSTSLVGTPYFSANLPVSPSEHISDESQAYSRSKSPIAPPPKYLEGLCRDEQDLETLYSSRYYMGIEVSTACLLYLKNEVAFLTTIMEKCNKNDFAEFQKAIDHATSAMQALEVSIQEALLEGNIKLVLVAAECCTLEVVRHCLEDGFPVDTQDSCGNTLLHMVCRSTKGAKEIKATISAIVTEGKASVNILNNDGFAPIHYAARYMLPEVIDVLLNLGCNPSLYSKAPMGFTAMEYALRRWQIYQDELSKSVMKMIWEAKHQRAMSQCEDTLQWGINLLNSSHPLNSTIVTEWSISCEHCSEPIPFTLQAIEPQHQHLSPPPLPLHNPNSSAPMNGIVLAVGDIGFSSNAAGWDNSQAPTEPQQTPLIPAGADAMLSLGQSSASPH